MIAVCSLAWGHEKVTQRWLESVRRNSGGHHVELFLLDNGSPDGTFTVMESFKPRWLQRNRDNESIYQGWNRLAQAALDAGADIICISNNDLLVGPGWLDPVVKNLVPGTRKYFLPHDGPGLGVNDRFDERARKIAADYADQIIPARAGWCLFFEREAIQHWLPIPEELQLWYGDDFIHWKLSQAGYTCGALLDSVCHHATSTTFFSRPGYAQIVDKDREIYFKITGERR